MIYCGLVSCFNPCIQIFICPQTISALHAAIKTIKHGQNLFFLTISSMSLCYQQNLLSDQCFVPLDEPVTVSPPPASPFSPLPPQFSDLRFNVILLNVASSFFYSSCWSMPLCVSPHILVPDPASSKYNSSVLLGLASWPCHLSIFHPLCLIAFELLPNPFCRVSILRLPSSLPCHCRSLLLALQPLLCFVPSYTMEQSLRTDPQGCDSNSGFSHFLYTYQKVLGLILTKEHFEFCHELVGGGCNIALFLFWLMQISSQKLISLLRRPCLHQTPR